MDDNELLDALDELVIAAQRNLERNQQVIDRARTVQRERRNGAAWREIITEEHKPLIVELLSQNMNVLSDIGSRVRRLEAEALHSEGMTMEAIGNLFGVTRQRVSELLRSSEHQQRS